MNCPPNSHTPHLACRSFPEPPPYSREVHKLAAVTSKHSHRQTAYQGIHSCNQNHKRVPGSRDTPTQSPIRGLPETQSSRCCNRRRDWQSASWSSAPNRTSLAMPKIKLMIGEARQRSLEHTHIIKIENEPLDLSPHLMGFLAGGRGLRWPWRRPRSSGAYAWLIGS